MAYFSGEHGSHPIIHGGGGGGGGDVNAQLFSPTGAAYGNASSIDGAGGGAFDECYARESTTTSLRFNGIFIVHTQQKVNTRSLTAPAARMDTDVYTCTT